MGQALELAARGLGLTAPNPAVGAVVVRDDRVVGRGWHRAAGTPHAEVLALRDAGAAARGADLYCTLEPCNHAGRTGPCTGAIAAAGIRRVFFGCPDPNPGVKGGGAGCLKRAGIAVTGGVQGAACAELVRAWARWVTTGSPWVTLKAAASVDGKIATRTGDSKWISSEASRAVVQRLRFEADAIMVGAGTVLKDNPHLTVRLPGLAGRKATLRVVLDGRLDVGPGARMYRDGAAPVLVVASRQAPEQRAAELRARGVEVLRVPVEGGGADLKKMLKELGARGVTHLLVEGGSEVHGAFCDARLYDEVHLFMAPVIIGGARAKTFIAGEGAQSMRAAQRLTLMSFERIGDDFHFVLRRTDGGGARVHRAG